MTITDDLPHVPHGYIPTTFQYRIATREAQASIAPAETLTSDALRAEQYRRLETMIGNTPLLHTETRNGCHIITKWESANPTETHYDRAYLSLIRSLEERGTIRPGDELIEITSGSAGTSFAWLASRLGYKATIIVPSELPDARVQEMINFGADVVRSEPGYVAQAAETLRARIKGFKTEGYNVDYLVGEGVNNVVTAEKDGHRACFVNHSEHEITVAAFEDIGNEIVRVLDGITIDHFVSVLGNWTSTTGISRALREAYPDLFITGLEDARAPKYHHIKNGLRLDTPGTFSPHDSFGSSAPNVRLRFDDVNLVDDIALMDSTQRDTTRDTFNGKNVFSEGRSIVETLGNTSAGALHQARLIADQSEPGTVILTIAYDLIDRYGEPVVDRQTALSLVESGPNDVRVDTRTQSQRAHLPRHGYWQRRVNSIDELPTSRLAADAGGLTRPFLSWALS